MDDYDHRILGPRLGLFHMQEDAPGQVFWHPRGHALYRALEDLVRRRMQALGFEEIRTPQLMPRSLWQRSGHWEKFAGAMFSVSDEDRPMALKPMSCPCHVQVFNQGVRSWRSLPLRYAEFGACHRNEASGAMHGLMRTRAFVQDDAHIFCRPPDVPAEVVRFIGLLRDVYAELGFDEIEVALSTRPAERFGSDEDWDDAEAALDQAARSCGFAPKVQPGEGAFYGPKLEFALRDRLGRSWQCGTVQLDYVLPGRLGATYVEADGGRAVPVMIHHAVLGSMARMIAVLLEHHAGRLPIPLAPEQVAILPLSDEQGAYAQALASMLRSVEWRARIFPPNDSLSRRIVEARELRIPVLAVVGRREATDGTVALRIREDAQTSVAAAELARRIAAAASADFGGMSVREVA